MWSKRAEIILSLAHTHTHTVRRRCDLYTVLRLLDTQLNPDVSESSTHRLIIRQVQPGFVLHGPLAQVDGCVGHEDDGKQGLISKHVLHLHSSTQP